MKTIYLLLFFNAFIFSAVAQDQGLLGTEWTPDELASTLKGEVVCLSAKCESSSGIKYFVVDIIREGAVYSNFYKVENNHVTHLGKDTTCFPLGRFIKDPEAVEKLWDDHFARWIKSEGKEAVQECLDSLNPNNLSDEEKTAFTKAGFTLPKN